MCFAFPSQTEVESLSAVVVAERLRAGLENLLDHVLSGATVDDETGNGTFKRNLATAALEMLNQPSLGLEPTVKNLLMEI